MPYYPYLPGFSEQPPPRRGVTEFDTTGLGPDPSAEYTGSSMEDFYEYLLTPRHQREFSGKGAISHFGPSRYASVAPEDAAMAEFLMKQMEAEENLKTGKAFNESELARRKAADEILMPQGRGGGMMSMGGGEPIQVGRGMEPPPALPPMDERSRQTLLAGGGGTDPITQAENSASAYGRGMMTEGQRYGVDKDVIRAKQAAAEAAVELESSYLPEGWEGLTADQIVQKALSSDPREVPPEVRKKIGLYHAAKQTLVEMERAGQGGGGGGAATPTDRIYNPKTGQTEPAP